MNFKILKSYFLFLDLFTCPVQLLIQKRRGYQTYFGAFTTLCCAVSILLYLANKLAKIDDRYEFQTLYSDVFHLEPPYYTLNENNFTLQFAFQRSNKTNYINESIYMAAAYLVNIKTTEVNGKKKETRTNVSLPISKCSKNGIIQDEISDQLDDQDLTNTYCLDWQQMESFALFGTDDNPEYQYISISFSVCVNGTKPGVTCADPDTIQSVLNRNYIHFQLTSYIINLRDFEQPQIPKIEDIYTTISAKVTKDIEIFMQPITTITDFGYFSQDLRKDTTIRFIQDKEIIDFNTDTSLADVVIRLSDTEQVSYRIYPKVQDVLAQAGGLWQILFAVAFFLQKPFSELAYGIRIVNALFNFEQETNKQKSGNTSADEDGQKLTTTTKGLLPTQDEAKKTEFKQEHQKEHKQETKPLRMKQVVSKRFPQGRINNTSSSKTSIVERIKQNDKINEIRSIFTTVSQNIKLKFKEYVQYLTYRPKRRKMDQLDYSIKKVESFLDILFIIDKLQEIDKLKMILLNKPQMNLFEFLPKPTIFLDPYSPKQAEIQYHSSILKPQKTSQEKAYQASLAFEELLSDFENPITKQLINNLDQEIVNTLIQEYEDRNRAKHNFISVGQSVICKIRQEQQQKQQELEQIGRLMPFRKCFDGTVQNSIARDYKEGSEESLRNKSQKQSS